ncbi:MAG: type II toxin-antitoxin system VapC family toxin [Dokdonella sp.]
MLDTHVLIWWLTGGTSLSRAAKLAVAKAAKENQVAASAISVLEIVTAVRRGRLEFSSPVEQWLTDVRRLPELRFEPVSAEIAQLAGSFGEDMHGDPADRIIAATAVILNAALITADGKLRASRAVKTIW